MVAEAGRGTREGAAGGFDPRRFVADARRIQALGFAATTDVAAALLPYLYADPPATGAAPPSELLRTLLARGDDVADGIAGVVRGVVGPLAEHLESWLTGRAAAPVGVPGAVELTASRGVPTTAMATIVTPVEVGPGRIWATDLAHASGARVGDVRCVPTTFERLAAGTSLPVRISVTVPPDAPSGRYVAHLLCTALPAVAQLVRLEVDDAT